MRPSLLLTLALTCLPAAAAPAAENPETTRTVIFKCAGARAAQAGTLMIAYVAGAAATLIEVPAGYVMEKIEEAKGRFNTEPKPLSPRAFESFMTKYREVADALENWGCTPAAAAVLPSP